MIRAQVINRKGEKAMSLRRLVVITLAVIGTAAPRDRRLPRVRRPGSAQGTHRGLRHRQIGRPFAIDGAFELEVLPSISVLAEHVSVGNVEWGSTPQMVGDRASLDEHRALVAHLGASGRPIVRAERRLGSPRNEPRRQGATGRSAMVLHQRRRLLRLRCHRSPRGHRARQARQCEGHLSRGRRAGPSCGARDTDRRIRHGRAAGDFRGRESSTSTGRRWRDT